MGADTSETYRRKGRQGTECRAYHATVVPIVTGERRKARKKQAEGRRTYRKKANAVHLCTDDLMSCERLVAYHDSYAKAMEKYGL